MVASEDEMGLDITAVSQIEKTGYSEAEYEEGDLWRTHIHVYRCQSVEFAPQFAGLEDDVVYSHGESHAFRAGSYGGYNAFRNWVCEQVNGMTAKELWNTEQPYDYPLGLWINFSDCEGFIGSGACALIYRQMVEVEDLLRFDELEGGPDYWRGLWADWKEAFRLGADDGCVQYH